LDLSGFSDMKKARTVEGQELEASAEAPKEAKCPVCGYPVTLHKRRLMSNQGYVYYWRHKAGGDLSCTARSGFVSRSGSRR